MGIEYREELVGKRFLCVVGNLKPKTPISEWPWRAGIIRAVDKTSPAVYGKDAIVSSLSLTLDCTVVSTC